jgi:drug/metabolite transporter (DMT)-like permease
MAFLYQLCSVWSILAAFVVFPDERRLARDRLFWTGTAAAVAGFVLLSAPSLLAGTGGSALGILIISLCGVCMGFYGVSVRYVLRDKHPLVLFSLVATYTSVGVLLAAPIGQPSALLRLHPPIMALVIASSLIGIAFAHGLFYIAVQRLGVAVSYLVLMSTPLLSYTCSWLWLGERLTALQWVGSVILLAGSATAVHAHNRLRSAVPPPTIAATAPAEANPPEPG